MRLDVAMVQMDSVLPTTMAQMMDNRLVADSKRPIERDEIDLNLLEQKSMAHCL